MREQCALHVRASSKLKGIANLGNHPMTRHDDMKRITPQRRTHGTARLRRTDVARDILICPKCTKWYLTNRIINFPRKVRPLMTKIHAPHIGPQTASSLICFQKCAQTRDMIRLTPWCRLHTFRNIRNDGDTIYMLQVIAHRHTAPSKQRHRNPKQCSRLRAHSIPCAGSTSK